MASRLDFLCDTLTPLREISLHEATHVVMGWRFGHLPEYVTVNPTEGCDGHVRWAPHVADTREDWLAILYTAAAPAGLVCVDGRSDWLSHGDSEKIGRVLPKCAPLTEREMYANVDRMVQADLQTMFAVARALVRRKRLTGRQVERIFRRVEGKAAAASPKGVLS